MNLHTLLMQEEQDERWTDSLLSLYKPIALLPKHDEESIVVSSKRVFTGFSNSDQKDE